MSGHGVPMKRSRLRSPSEACLPEGYYFALDALPLLRIHLELGLIQHHCEHASLRTAKAEYLRSAANPWSRWAAFA